MFNLRNGWGARCWTALLAIGLVGEGTLLAQRDDYKVAPGRETIYDIPPETKPSDLKRVTAQKNGEIRGRRQTVRESLSADNPFNKARETELDKWYLGYEFPTMTLYTPEALKDLYEARKRLIRQELEQATNVPARDHLVDLALKFFKDVAREDYHPAVRYNAMLIIGELDARVAVRAGTGTPPVPLRAALDFMIQEFKNPDQIDAVRLAALLGINRHVQLDAQADTFAQSDQIPQAEWQDIRTLALELVRTREAPAGRTQDGHDWMRRRALEILSWLAAAKLDQEIVDEVIARLSDSDENRGVRNEAVVAISNMKYLPESAKPRLGSAALKVKTKEVAANLLQYAVDVVTVDVARVDKYVKSMQEADEIYNSSGGGGGMSGAGRMMGRGMAAPGGRSGGGPPPGMSAPRPMGSGGGGPPPGMTAPRPGGSKGGGPPPGSGAPRPSTKRGVASGDSMPNFGAGMGAYGGIGSGQVDPYSYRLEPVYRKLRYEIGCVMKALRGTEEWRPRDGTGGLYPPKTQATPDDKEFLERAGKALKVVADKFKVKTDELDTQEFVVEKLSLQGLTTLINEVVAKAKPKAAEPEAKDPLKEPDPADDDLLEPVKPAAKASGDSPAVKTAAAAAKAAK